jgi:uncharacterized glyoxalase superfamily protein PhnB
MNHQPGSAPVIREVFPYLCVRDAAAALEFYVRVFGADKLLRLTDARGRVRDAGATVLREPENQGHGERQSRIRDPFGHEWLLGHELEALSAEEISARFQAEQDAS